MNMEMKLSGLGMAAIGVAVMLLGAGEAGIFFLVLGICAMVINPGRPAV